MRRFFYEIKLGLIAVKDFFYKIFLISRYYTGRLFFQIINFFHIIFSFLIRFMINILTLPENIFYFFRFIFRKTKDVIVIVKDKVVYAFQGIFYLFEDFFKTIGRFFSWIFRLIIKLFKNIGLGIKNFFIGLGNVLVICIKRFYNIFLIIPILIIFVIFLVIALIVLVYQTFVMLIMGITNTSERASENKLIYVRPLFNPSFGVIRAYQNILYKMNVRKYSTIIDSDEHKYFVELSRKMNFVFFSIIGFIFMLVFFIALLPLSLPILLFEVTIGIPIIRSLILKRIVVKKDTITDNFSLKSKKIFGKDIKFIPSDETLVSIDGIVNPNMQPISLINGKEVTILCVINGEEKEAYKFMINVDETNNELLNIYRKIEIPSLITGSIDLTKFSFPNTKIEWKSLSPTIITDDGVIISDHFRMNNKVYFIVTITKGNRYIRKSLMSSILIDNEDEIVKYYLDRLPKDVSITRGKIILPIPKYIDVSYDEIEDIINRKGEVKEQKYGKDVKIKIILEYNEAKKSKMINLHIGTTKRGKISILSAIKLPKMIKDSSELVFYKAVITKDDYTYQIKWIFPENASISELDNQYILNYPEPRSKTTYYKIKAMVSFAGKDYYKKFRVIIPASSKAYMLKYEYDKLTVEYQKGWQWLYFPKKTQEYKCRIIWVSKNPELISSRGKIRYKMLNKKNNGKEVRVDAYLFKRFHVMRKTFTFKIELPENDLRS